MSDSAERRKAMTSIRYSPSPVRIDNLCVNRGGKQLFQNFSIEFEAGKTTVIMAPSGSGKTTLLDCIAGLYLFDSGSVFAGSVFLHPSYLFQEPRLLPWRTLEENVVLPLLNIIPQDEAHDRARMFLAKTGLSDRCRSYPAHLSGGERQRVALARAFAFPSPLLLMDEAFQSQDLHLKMELMSLMKRLLCEEKRTVLLVTHDPREALCLGDRILLLSGQPLAVVRDIRQKTDSASPSAVSGAMAETRVRRLYTSPSESARSVEDTILKVLSGVR